MPKKLAALIAVPVVLFSLSAPADNHEPDSAFSKNTIDLGCVVSDLEESVKFYTEVIGFQKSGAFRVDADFAAEAGLTDGKPLDITVLTLGEGPAATKLKLMQVDAPGAKAANDYIHSTLGYSYITIYVNSVHEAMSRLRRARIAPDSNGQVSLPGDIDSSQALILVRDPDGNFIELIGPVNPQ